MTGILIRFPRRPNGSLSIYEAPDGKFFVDHLSRDGGSAGLIAGPFAIRDHAEAEAAKIARMINAEWRP